MDTSVQKALSDKLYDKRKGGALELENLIRSCLAANDHDRIARIVHQLCQDYAYAVHQPHARNGGLIGLAAAAIALGGEVAKYLREIVPPVLACFTDQDARVRYYACESMYNIAKVAKGEVLIYFNDVFDALCKLAADTEVSVKNGAELLDRLVKDIVSESAASYISILQPDPQPQDDGRTVDATDQRAFKLPAFIPLLQERIHVLNPFTRTFLVSWITLLDSIPDLELVSFLPSFLGGLLRFLSDVNQDVHTTTKVALGRFLFEIRKVAAIKQSIATTRQLRNAKRRSMSDAASFVRYGKDDTLNTSTKSRDGLETRENDVHDDNDDQEHVEEEYIPGQDIQVDHSKILDILLKFLSDTSEEEIQTTTLGWIESFFDICPDDILHFVPRLLSQVLPALSHDVEKVRQAANRVNDALTSYIMSLPDEAAVGHVSLPSPVRAIDPTAFGNERSRKSVGSAEPSQVSAETNVPTPITTTSQLTDAADDASSSSAVFDYEAAVNALTLQFLNEHEASRVAAISWLIMLHRKSPRRILAIHEGTFPALLKTLSDPSQAVVTRDLLLLSQICQNSDDSYFTVFMVSLLKLFCTDRKLLETRGNLIIRQLCVNLSAERIYRTLADCLEKDEDLEFASIMVQNLNNNLITAPELAELRKRLRNLDAKEGQTFFVTLFRSWCHNAVATFSLCLLAQAYEQAYHLLQIFTELEMTVNMLIQIDKLVQLLESPVFTYLRLQLLEPERYPHLYKCMYGVLMLLPQSSAFAALKNRLNSVSAIGYLHIAPRGGSSTPAVGPPFEKPGRLRGTREDGTIRWTELLDEFRMTQDRARRVSLRQSVSRYSSGLNITGLEDDEDDDVQPKASEKTTPVSRTGMAPAGSRPTSVASAARPVPIGQAPPPTAPPAGHQKKSSLSQLSRFRVAGKSKKTT